MAWPQAPDYFEAIQNPQVCFRDADLHDGQPAVNALGLPMPRSGNFADVYEIRPPAGPRRWAVKCFTRAVPDLQTRYRHVSAYLKQVNPPFAVDFCFLEKGIRVNGEWFPVLKMPWIEGYTLQEFVKQFLDKPKVFDGLARIWVRLAQELRHAGITSATM